MDTTQIPVASSRNREEALNRLEVAAVPEVVGVVEAKLGVSPSHRRGKNG